MPLTLDVMLDFDGDTSQMVALMRGVRVLQLRWDGVRLDQRRWPDLSSALEGRRVLAEAQLAWWPSEAIAAALPANARLVDAGQRRSLFLDGIEVVRIDYPEPPRWNGRTTFTHLTGGYSLLIDSTAAPTAPTLSQ